MNSPVGIFDSGLGGLSVVKEIMATMPGERVIYLADNAHVPYGERPLDEVKGFACEITSYLIRRGAKAVVMACNMSSAIALDSARAAHPGTPILGVIEPAAETAVHACGGHPIGVLATTGTVKSEAYLRVIRRLDPAARVVQQACPRFVPLVESGSAGSEEAEVAARMYVQPLLAEGCRTIVLGCTHYPFLIRPIRAAVGESISIIDPARETSLQLARILSECGLASTRLDGQHEFLASGAPEVLVSVGSPFLGTPINGVARAEWGIDLSEHDLSSPLTRGIEGARTSSPLTRGE